jgi:hypothetical protein
MEFYQQQKDFMMASATKWLTGMFKFEKAAV